MKQTLLFEELGDDIESPIRREEEIRRPFERTLRTLFDGIRVFYFSALLGTVLLFGLRLTCGKHNQGEEIVVLATPLIICFIALRLIRTHTEPLSEAEVRASRELLKQDDFLTALFGFGLLMLILVLASDGVYLYFGIQWGSAASNNAAKLLVCILLLISACMFFGSSHARSEMEKVVRYAMIIPEEARKKIERLGRRRRLLGSH